MNPASYMREITILPRIGITAQPVRLEGSVVLAPADLIAALV